MDAHPNNSLDYINSQYGLNVQLQDRVTYVYGMDEDSEPKPNGTVVGSDGGHLVIKMDDNPLARRYHPTWCMVHHSKEN